LTPYTHHAYLNSNQLAVYQILTRELCANSQLLIQTTLFQEVYQSR
jgi:hypothetical protein